VQRGDGTVDDVSALTSEMRAIDGYRIVLNDLAGVISAHWQGTIDHRDTDALHDFRIALRRTRTVLRAARKVLPADILQTTGPTMARLAQLTGPPRDLDVYLSEWPAYTASLTSAAVHLAPVHAQLAERADRAHGALSEAMRSTEGVSSFERWLSWLQSPSSDREAGSHAELDLGRVVGQHIERAQHRLLERGRRIRFDTPAEEVHDLRKDAKGLRYLCECFGSLLDEEPRALFVRRLKALQEYLGALQDTEVHLADVRQISAQLDRTNSVATICAIAELEAHLNQRRVLARVEFRERFGAYDTGVTRRLLAHAMVTL
jgi:CHAD domain-containing protein